MNGFGRHMDYRKKSNVLKKSNDRLRRGAPEKSDSFNMKYPARFMSVQTRRKPSRNGKIWEIHFSKKKERSLCCLERYEIGHSVPNSSYVFIWIMGLKVATLICARTWERIHQLFCRRTISTVYYDDIKNIIHAGAFHRFKSLLCSSIYRSPDATFETKVVAFKPVYNRTVQVKTSRQGTWTRDFLVAARNARILQNWA